MPGHPSTTRSASDIDPIVVRRSRDLLDRAEILFENADGVEDGTERFRQYYLTALRAAGAAIEIHEPSIRPVRRRHSRNAKPSPPPQIRTRKPSSAIMGRARHSAGRASIS